MLGTAAWGTPRGSPVPGQPLDLRQPPCLCPTSTVLSSAQPDAQPGLWVRDSKEGEGGKVKG